MARRRVFHPALLGVQRSRKQPALVLLPTPRHVDARNQEVNQLQEKVQKISQPDVAKAIAVGVRSIGNGTSAVLYQREFVVSTEIEQAMEDQEQIGWDHFMMSRMAKKWSAIGPNEAYIGIDGKYGKRSLRSTPLIPD